MAEEHGVVAAEQEALFIPQVNQSLKVKSQFKSVVVAVQALALVQME